CSCGPNSLKPRQGTRIGSRPPHATGQVLQVLGSAHHDGELCVRTRFKGTVTEQPGKLLKAELRDVCSGGYVVLIAQLVGDNDLLGPLSELGGLGLEHDVVGISVEALGTVVMEIVLVELRRSDLRCTDLRGAILQQVAARVDAYLLAAEEIVDFL